MLIMINTAQSYRYHMLNIQTHHARGKDGILTCPIQKVDSRVIEQYLILH